MADYKANIDALNREMDAIGGGDLHSLGSGRSRKALAEEAEMASVAKFQVEKGRARHTVDQGAC